MQRGRPPRTQASEIEWRKSLGAENLPEWAHQPAKFLDLLLHPLHCDAGLALVGFATGFELIVLAWSARRGISRPSWLASAASPPTA
jgi:hypothetical protein